MNSVCFEFLSSNVLGHSVNGTCVLFIKFNWNFLCCLFDLIVFSYVVRSEFDLRNLMHSMDLYVQYMCCWYLWPLCMFMSKKVALSWCMSYVNLCWGENY